MIDVRSRGACEAGHAAPARCLPLEALLPMAPWELSERTRRHLSQQLARVAVGPNERVLVIGAPGRAGLQRAASACWLTSLAGVESCHIVRGGHRAWEQAGGEIVTEEVAEPRTDVAPVRVATSPQTWAGHDALRHASIEPGVALIQVATAQRHGEIPGAFELPVFDVVSDDHRVDGEALTRLLGDAGLLAEDQMIVVGRGFEDGALAWFLLDRVADLPAVRLYPGGMERYRRVALLPLHEQVEEPAEAPATGGSQLDDREVDG